MKGLRLHLPPFAPDDAGATSVLYPLGGLVTILDAGGCAGNLCGFDEPRFYKKTSPFPPRDATPAPLETPYSPRADSEQSERFRPLGASPTSAKPDQTSGGRGLCDSERSGEHLSGAEKTDKAALKTAPSSPIEPNKIARKDSPLSESAQSPRPAATTKPSSANCAAPLPSIFTSAALRDMDAILGRDTALLKKLAAAAQTLHPTGRPLPFLALIGTPVPAVIGTDLPALARLAEKNLHIPALPIETDGTAPYDTGIEKTYQALFPRLAHIPTTKNPPSPLKTPCSPQADKERSDYFRPLGASTSAKTSPSSGGRGLCDSERSGEHPSDAEKTNKAALKNATTESPSSPRSIAREDSPLSESAQSPRPTATAIPLSATTNNLRAPIGVLGSTPLDLPPGTTAQTLRRALHAAGFHHLRLYGLDSDLTHYTRAAENRLNLVIAPAGLPAARWLQKTFGTPYQITWPLAAHQLAAATQTTPLPRTAKNILILHQQIAANALRTLLQKTYPKARITCATSFTLIGALAKPQDQKLREETDLPALVQKEHYDLILADPLYQRTLPNYNGTCLPLPHPAVSGFPD
ncbi:nitrogenase component 1 [uncultured Selenomonas sp.]|uniref:nitrogenase component 1 n=1 Tax=uncultured Selenomonas sp. TaxID=159275 RepID=UPI0025DA097B|nr:nitrogenase component 1 [uncultured Selenomonas sp.]